MMIFSLPNIYLAAQYAGYRCCKRAGSLNRLPNAGTGSAVVWHMPVCCGGTVQDTSSPFHHPCSGAGRHGEVLPPAVIVNHGKAVKAGCYGASIPPETQG